MHPCAVVHSENHIYFKSLLYFFSLIHYHLQEIILSKMLCFLYALHVYIFLYTVLEVQTSSYLMVWKQKLGKSTLIDKVDQVQLHHIIISF